MSDAEALQNALDDPDNPPLTDRELKEFVPASELSGNTLLEKYGNLRKKRCKKLV